MFNNCVFSYILWFSWSFTGSPSSPTLTYEWGYIGDQPVAVRCHTVCTFRGLDNSYIYDTLTYTDSAIKIPQFKTSLQALFMGIKDPSFGPQLRNPILENLAVIVAFISQWEDVENMWANKNCSQVAVVDQAILFMKYKMSKKLTYIYFSVRIIITCHCLYKELCYLVSQK